MWTLCSCQSPAGNRPLLPSITAIEILLSPQVHFRIEWNDLLSLACLCFVGRLFYIYVIFTAKKPKNIYFHFSNMKNNKPLEYHACAILPLVARLFGDICVVILHHYYPRFFLYVLDPVLCLSVAPHAPSAPFPKVCCPPPPFSLA